MARKDASAKRVDLAESRGPHADAIQREAETTNAGKKVNDAH
jgi:hypothetical protein